MSLTDLGEIAILAGGIMKTYATHFGMERIVKGDSTPLTKADTEVNDLVIARVRAISTEVDIVAEERDDRRESPWQLTCDPVDGTFPYSWGMPVSTCMLGLMYEGQPVMGVIYDPFTDRLYGAERGKGAWMNGHRLQVSTAATGKDRPVVGYCSWPTCRFNILKVCQYLEERGVSLVCFYSVGYAEALVANGEFAASIFPGDKYHDTVPGHILITEAGGEATDIYGNPPRYGEEKFLGHVMSNGRIHDLILEAVHACNKA